MAYFCTENQSMIFAFRPKGAGDVLAVIGKALEHELNAMTWTVADTLTPDAYANLTAGVYVWEGELSGDTGGWAGSEPIEPETNFDGIVRPATLADFDRFSIPRPEDSGRPAELEAALRASHAALDGLLAMWGYHNQQQGNIDQAFDYNGVDKALAALAANCDLLPGLNLTLAHADRVNALRISKPV